jgi:hypothetical protein
MKLSRRAWLGAAATTGAAGLAWHALGKPPAELPRARVKPVARPAFNVLFILTDQERSWAQLPAGFIERHCPHRHWLRQRAVEVTRANTTSQLCSMARGTNDQLNRLITQEIGVDDGHFLPLYMRA